MIYIDRYTDIIYRYIECRYIDYIPFRVLQFTTTKGGEKCLRHQAEGLKDRQTDKGMQ